MSLIEQANRRLEELRRAGIDIPAVPAGVGEGETRSLSVKTSAASPRQPTMVGQSARPVAATSEARGVEQAPQAHSKLVQIDLERLSVEGYLTSSDPRMGLAEEMRAVKRPIINHAREAKLAGDARGNLILVTSALPGEGKTYCAINLAMSIAMEVDHSVLLIDADVVRPSVMSRMGVDAELGLLDVLTNPDLDLSDVLLRTNIPKLSLLPAGSPTDKSTELLASAAMEHLLADVAERYSDRIVIFDGPPLLATSESRVLAARMGQVLMVVQAQKTSQSAVSQAFADVEACKTVWCVLNKATSERAAVGYGRYSQLHRD